MTYLDPNHIIYVLSNHQIVDKSIYRNNVWKAAHLTNNDLSSRSSWLTGLTLVYDYAHHLYFRDGTRYKVPDIHKIFPDPQNRWMTDFLKADETGKAPASYSRYYERLRLIELYCRLRRVEALPAPEHWEGAASKIA